MNIRYLLCALFFNLGIIAPIIAKHDQYQQSLSGSAIQNGTVLTVTDGRYSEISSGTFSFINHKVYNQVALQIQLPEGSAAYTTTIELKTTYDAWNGTQFQQQVKNSILVVNYTPGGAYHDQALVQWEGGHKMKVEVINVNGPVAALTLSGKITIERYEKLNTTSQPSAASINGEEIPSRGELLVTWAPIAGAEEYDLEWLYLNNYSETNEALAENKISLQKNLFRLNSTRVTTINQQYAIPLIYDRGYILYRIRAVGRSEDTGFQMPLAGRWSFEPQDGQTVADAPHKFLFSGHQTNVNWQATVSFAEEGKNKAAISYFDGSLRNRQAVSRLNTEDKIIVGETMYDHQGRAAVQVLPVPVQKAKIGYERSFNKNEEGKPYNREDFDEDLENCEVSPTGMSTVSGASLYYSPDNPDKEGHQAYLPDAKKYPFTQVEYTPDNTGRIRRQSGVGVDHKLGSGHETKYFYGKANQTELDRLFGSDVGFAEHYKKNMVADANGQVSVSYLDPQGRVIATALAGETPESLSSISKPEDEIVMEVDLLGKVNASDRQGTENRIAVDGKSKVLSQQLLVAQDGTRNFDYDLQTVSYTEEGEICYDCVLDLAIQLTDECGDLLIDPIGENGSSTVTLGENSLDCEDAEGTAYSNAFSSTSQLPKGSYNLSRTLAINQEALDIYTVDFLSKQADANLLKFEYFLEKEGYNIEIFDCEADCQSCLDAIGEYDARYTGPNCNPCLTRAEYEELYKQCDVLCDDSGVQCENALQMMKADMSPFGQYGELMEGNTINEDGAFEPVGNNAINPSSFPLSIFNEHNKLTRGDNANWRKPYIPTGDGNGIKNYLNEQGQIDYVDILVNAEGGFLPELTTNANIPANLKPGDFFQVVPEDLKNIEDFIRYWKPSWANSLVYYHPEYPYYEYCVTIQDSHDFDARWLATDNVQRAQDLNFLSNDLYPNPLNYDPYFASSGENHATPEQKKFMQNAFNNFTAGYSLWLTVHRTINCPAAVVDDTKCTDCPEYDGINTDAEWNTFKSMYFNLKQKMVEYKMSMYAIGNKSYNGCIGATNDNPFRYFNFSYMTGFFGRSQTCNYETIPLYAEKAKRFPMHSDMIETDEELDFETCYGDFDTGTNALSSADVGFEVIECTDNLLGVIEEAKAKVDYQFYERCGQCPLAHDLQVLLNGVAQKDGLNAQEFLLSCYPESNYPEWTPDLEDAITAGFASSTGQIFWQKQNTSVGGSLVVNIGDPTVTGSTCELKLKIVEEGFTFADIKEVCCLNYEPNPSQFPLLPGKNFTFKASVGNEGKKITVEGVTGCLDLQTCVFPPSCKITKDATDLQTLLNALVFDFEIGVDNQALVSGTNINLNNHPYKEIVSGRFSGLPKMSGWIGDVTGNVLQGTLMGEGGTAFEIVLTKTTNAFDFDDIVGFKDIRADRDHPTDPEHSFIITARVQTDLGIVNINLSGHTLGIQIGDCTYPELPDMARGGHQ